MIAGTATAKTKCKCRRSSTGAFCILVRAQTIVVKRNVYNSKCNRRSDGGPFAADGSCVSAV